MLRKAYYYLFYKLYKFYENGPSAWLSDWKASFSIDVLIVFILLTIGGYYSIITKKEMLPADNAKFIIWVVGLSIALINYLIFNYHDRWKKIIDDFDNLPRKKNKIGTWIIWGVIFFVFINLIFMFCLMSRIDWKVYR